MSIEDLEISKKLKKAGEKLGRAKLAERALEIAYEIIGDGSYKRAIRGAGQLKALAQACKYDDYWDEKMLDGFFEEVYNLEKSALESPQLPASAPAHGAVAAPPADGGAR